MMAELPELEVRAATTQDDPAVLQLLRDTMGWDSGGHDEDFFWWKHRENPFGVSPAWVAVADGQVVGYRTFLRWSFIDDRGRIFRAVRAVDTVTHPGHRGRGIFRTLTLHGVADLTRAGDAWVFNTPNDQSRPGYLKMGWTVAGRLPVGVMPRGISSAATMARAREAASLWSEETTVGLDAPTALADESLVTSLLAHAPQQGVRTLRTPEYLRWRTSFAPLRYRVLLSSDIEPDDGGLVFRLRRRGPALEAAIIEELSPTVRSRAALVRRLLHATGADYAIGLRDRASAPLIPLPRQGPILTTRPLAATPPGSAEWSLSLGDIELF